MSHTVPRRAALRAVQLTLLAVGLFFLFMLLSSRQAHAATSDDQPQSATLTSTFAQGAQSVLGDAGPGLGSAVAAVTTPLTDGSTPPPAA